MNFIWYRNTHRFIPENNRPEDLWVFFVYIRFLVMQVFEEIYNQGNTIVLVTHEDDISRYARRIVKLRDGLIEYDKINENPTLAK